MSVYKQAKNEEYVLKVFNDDMAESPREWDNLGTMVCWHRSYNLGDENDYSEPRDFLTDLASENITDEERFYLDEDEYECDKLEDMDMDGLLELVEKSNIILPLYLYDHSGITINTTGFSCPWDSGQVGWIYCNKERFIKETGYTEDELFSTDKHRIPKIGEHVIIKGLENKRTGDAKVIEVDDFGVHVDFGYCYCLEARKEDDRGYFSFNEITEVTSNRAIEMLQGEVQTYDDYLTGSVYGFELHKINKGELFQDFTNEKIIEMDYDELEPYLEETNSCWGFYGDNFLENGLLDYVGNDLKSLVENLEYA